LSWAVVKGDLEMTKWLVQHAADLKAKNSEDKTALMLAQETKRAEMIALLDDAAPKVAPSPSGNEGNDSPNSPKAAGDTQGKHIDGAFGLRLGDTFDTAHAVRMVPSPAGEVPVYIHRVVYKFTPSKPLPPFERYYVEITPKTQKICTIFAKTGGILTTEKEQLDVIVAALSKKYGKGKSSDDLILYDTEVDGKSITLSYWPQQGVTLTYRDWELEKLAKDEVAAQVKAERDSQQGELDRKAKALERSGL
jgi:hypothetical protein